MIVQIVDPCSFSVLFHRNVLSQGNAILYLASVGLELTRALITTIRCHLPHCHQKFDVRSGAKLVIEVVSGKGYSFCCNLIIVLYGIMLGVFCCLLVK